MEYALPAEQRFSEQAIAARIERLPHSAWHVRVRLIVGTATFFDAFDLVAIATVLPTLVTLWAMSPQQVGALISVGFAGQAIGAILFGWLAERIGRVKTATISIAIFAVVSLLCTLANSLEVLLVLRFIQGIGLGGEVPIAATYVNEIAKARGRGRFFLIYECIFLVGLLACSLAGAYIVPRFGYYWMFVLGGLPALLVVALRRYCPESPRWLASCGRGAEADAVLSGIEREVARSAPLPPADLDAVVARSHGRTNWTELFGHFYLRRTLVVWVMWFCSYLFTYGLLTWLPTIYRTVFHVSVQEALLYGAMASLLGLVGGIASALLIDRVGRRIWMTAAFALASLPMIVLALLGGGTLSGIVALSGLASLAINCVTVVLYLYTPEIYPTRMRALGSSWATFWPRLSSFIGANLVGMILPIYGTTGVFLLFAGISVVGAAACGAGAVETRGKVLEEISP